MRTVARKCRSIAGGACLAAAAMLACGSARAAVVIEGVVDCRDWLEGRANHTAENLEHYVLGLLNGLTLGRGKEFWRAGGSKFSPTQAYGWIDDYCRANPMHQVMTGAGELFKQRTEMGSAGEGKKR